MKLCTAVQEGCGYKDTLHAHRYFALLAKYFTVCITYQPPLICEKQECYYCSAVYIKKALKNVVTVAMIGSL